MYRVIAGVPCISAITCALRATCALAPTAVSAMTAGAAAEMGDWHFKWMHLAGANVGYAADLPSFERLYMLSITLHTNNAILYFTIYRNGGLLQR
jgi:hypothetical protein